MDNTPADPRGRKRSDADRSVGESESTPAGLATPGVPFPGRNGAASPILAVEEREIISIPADMMRKNNIYVLQVRGNSMLGAYVLDGDHVIMQKRNTVKDGELVVAMIRNSETALKRFHRSEGMIELESPNPSHEVTVLDEKDVAIQGVVVGILRKYGAW